MSKKITEVTLLELLPENLRSDPDIIAASQVLDTEFQALVSSIKNCLTIADIDNASSKIVDNLAGEINVEFYDQTLSLDKRKALVKNGYLYKYRKGTADAVKRIVTDAFDQTTLNEWFEYNGEPFYFKITTEANLPSESKIADLVNVISNVKNVRSTLESIEASKRTELKGYYGFGLQQTLYHNVTLHQLIWNQLDTLGMTWDELDLKNISWTGLEMFQ